MNAAVVVEPKKPFVVRSVPMPEPKRGQVRIKVAACGVCHSDAFVAEGQLPGVTFPRIPGHEIAGTVDATGEGVTALRVGMRVGVGYHGGRDNTCAACREGDFVLCESHTVTGISYDGGYAEYVVVPEEAVAFVPDSLSFADAAPLLCAGVTTFNSLRHADALPGALVAVQGLGGLGHLAIQFAAKMGFEVIAVSGDGGKRDFAQQLGAHHYCDTSKESFGDFARKLGGARVVLATAPSGKSISKLVAGLGSNGTLLVVGAAFDPIEVSATELITKRARVQGWPSGAPQDSTETMRFAALHGVRPMIECFPLADAYAAYRRMMAGEVRFRAVLQMG